LQLVRFEIEINIFLLLLVIVNGNCSNHVIIVHTFNCFYNFIIYFHYKFWKICTNSILKL
jgi:hypothetical protein